MLSSHNPACIRRHQQGFTLVEIMVAMVIGMLGIVIIMQMATTFEAQKRTTTGGDDAQNAGAIALYSIQQGLQQAGYCFATSASAVAITLPLGATVGSVRPAMVNPVPLANNAAISDANTDTLLVTYGNDSCPIESASGVANAALNVWAYAVKNGSLMQCDYLANDCSTPGTWWASIAGGVVSLRAVCVGAQSIRIALVTRNPQLEKIIVTDTDTDPLTRPGVASAPTWSGTPAAIDLSLTAVDTGFAWQNYRYKTFETVVPIRNSIWSGAAGC